MLMLLIRIHIDGRFYIFMVSPRRLSASSRLMISGISSAVQALEQRASPNGRAPRLALNVGFKSIGSICRASTLDVHRQWPERPGCGAKRSLTAAVRYVRLYPFQLLDLNQIPSPRLRPKLQSTLPPGVIVPVTCRPSCCSSAGRQGTSWNPRPSSIMANRPDASVTRWR